ncbi:hypothetical protein KJ910_02955 [Patescibacteria group bacterium]|nr:hypothetical protein [Patescibacteria group bacterium]MBU1907076.1 hypothetical protein [Patescibacteria group bacterium]
MKNNMTNDFFVFLCETYDIFTSARRFQSIGSWESFLDDMRHQEMYKQLRKKQTLRRLGEKNWIEMREKGNEVELRLTVEGKKALDDLSDLPPVELPANQTCCVVYDFPVGANRARDKFRYHLKKCGFRKLQDSVWITSKDVGARIADLVNKLDIKKWVWIINGELISVT